MDNKVVKIINIMMGCLTVEFVCTILLSMMLTRNLTKDFLSLFLTSYLIYRLREFKIEQLSILRKDVSVLIILKFIFLMIWSVMVYHAQSQYFVNLNAYNWLIIFVLFIIPAITTTLLFIYYMRLKTLLHKNNN